MTPDAIFAQLAQQGQSVAPDLHGDIALLLRRAQNSKGRGGATMLPPPAPGPSNTLNVGLLGGWIASTIAALASGVVSQEQAVLALDGTLSQFDPVVRKQAVMQVVAMSDSDAAFRDNLALKNGMILLFSALVLVSLMKG